MAGWLLGKGAYGVEKKAAIKKKDGSKKDVTGLTVTLKIYQDDPDSPIISTTLAKESPETDGIVRWDVTQENANALAAKFNGEEFLLFNCKTWLSATAPPYNEPTEKFSLKVEK